MGLEYDKAIDLWSVAVTLFELYKGSPILPGVNNNEVGALGFAWCRFCDCRVGAAVLTLLLVVIAGGAVGGGGSDAVVVLVLDGSLCSGVCVVGAVGVGVDSLTGNRNPSITLLSSGQLTHAKGGR